MTTPQESTEAEGNPCPEETSETLGNLLRRTRQDKRVALEVAAKETRINATTLEALETDNRDALPAEVFTRGFVKIYAQYLGLDPNEALQKYLHHRGEKTAIPDEKINAQEVLAGESMAVAPAFHAERHLFTAAVIVLISLILYLGYKITSPPPEPPAPEQLLSEPLPQQTLPPVQETVPSEETAQEQTPLLAEKAPAAPTAVPPPLTPPALPPAQALPAAPTTMAPTQAVPAKTARVEPLVPPNPAPPASMPRQTPAPAPQASAPALPPVVTPPASAKIASPATQGAPLPSKTALPAVQPATALPPAATATTKLPLKELAPPGPIKKEKTDKVGPAVAAAEAEKSARELSTAEKLIAAIKPLRPPYALEATFREDTWVRVQIDNEKPKPQYFRAGDKSAWQANSKIQLFIGNAGGVDLVLNNTRLPPLGKPGNTTRISIQPQSDQR